jgi:hypothetical protein
MYGGRSLKRLIFRLPISSKFRIPTLCLWSVLQFDDDSGVDFEVSMLL